MNRISKLGFVMLAAVVAACVGTAGANEFRWDRGAGTNDWHTAANWYDATALGEPANAPTAADDALITNSSSSANHVQITSAAVANTLQAGPRIGATNHTGYLDIQANVSLTSSFALHAKGTGYVWHSAGDLKCTDFSISGSTTIGGTGTYQLSGTGTIVASGALTGSGGTASVFIQDGASTSAQFASVSTGSTNAGDRFTYQLKSGALAVTGDVSRSYGAWHFEQTGGTATVSGDLSMGNNYRSNSSGGPMEWSIKGDSSLSVTGNVTLGWVGDGGSHLGSDGTGQVTLDGSKGSGSDVTVGGYWRQTGSGTPNTTGSMGTLKAVIDTAAVATSTGMRKVVVTGNVTFDSGSTLDVGFDTGVTPPATKTTWTLMTWSGSLTNNGLGFAGGVDTSTWSFDANATTKKLTVTYIPEPGTLAVLGLGGVVVLIRRRRTR